MPKTRYDYENESKEYQRKIAEQEGEIRALKDELMKYQKEAKRVQELKNEYNRILSEEYWKPVVNERGAGRKPKINEAMIRTAKAMESQGATQRQIAERLGVSVGLINKAVNSVG
jgi:hypothetical protein